MPEEERDNGPIRLDPLDRKVLDCLREDGRMSVSEISRRTEASQNTVKRRLARLGERGGMKVVPVIEPYSIGLDDCFYVGIKVETGRVREVSDRIRDMPEVRYLAHTTGPWDLLVEAFVGSRSQMAEFLLTTIGELPGIISTETWNVLEIAKFGYEWEIPEY